MFKQGETIVPSSHLTKSFELQLKAEDKTRSWDAQIVVSDNDPSLLPKSLKKSMLQHASQVAIPL